MADAHQHTVVVSSMEGVDGAGMPKQPRASRPVVLAVYAAMALTGGVGLAQVGKTRTAASPTSSQASASLAEMAGEWEEMSEYQYGNSNCSEYDDDSIYTSDVCGDFDAGACANYCKGGDWCSYFCTNATTSSTEFGCDSGSGAICALQTLANIEKTCRVVESMNYTSKPDTWGTSHAAAEDGTLPGTPARSRPDRRLDEDIGKIAHNSSDVDNEGCDEHVFCEYVAAYRRPTLLPPSRPAPPRPATHRRLRTRSPLTALLSTTYLTPPHRTPSHRTTPQVLRRRV